MDIDISSKRFNNLIREERNALYNLRDDPAIIIIGASKGSAVVVWDREDYLKEAYKQLEDKDIYEEVPNDSSILINTIKCALEKIRMRGNLPNDTRNYFLVKDPKFAKGYLLPKIHKRSRQTRYFKLWILHRKHLLISRPSFTTYSSKR